MGSPTLSTYMLSSTSFSSVISNSSKFPLQNPITNTPLLKPTTHHLIRPLIPKPRAAPGETDQTTTTPLLIQEEEQPNKQVTESVKLLKNAAKTRRVVTEEVLSALSVIEKTKLDSSGFLETLGGSKSPGRTWMLIFTAEKGLERGKYFPITAVQRFDAAVSILESLWLIFVSSLPIDRRSHL
ncbi:hypothetical protein RJ640_005107 [Escallonia rubra]|uniref:Uncharacterized protein n=1 Tax=Escallonia rubra TaxID=112253 RepID=A0AA88RNL3_9ASTE|nr:hypothetical protein RJ640_005107 [Escallonia rubra]